MSTLSILEKIIETADLENYESENINFSYTLLTMF